jgi:cytochrome c peroxidase
MRLFIIIAGCLGFIAVPRLIRPPAPPHSVQPPFTYSTEVQSAVEYFQTESRAFASSCTALRKSLESLQPAGSETRSQARQHLIECRCHYKKIESFLEYFFRSSSTIYNKPPKYEAEEGGMEYQSPAGLQVIESLLYEPRIDRKALLEQARAVESAAVDLPALLYDLKADDRQLLESLRVELIRVMALDITGYEAPLLKSGIRESAEALRSLSVQLQPYLRPGEPRSDSLRYFLDKAIAMTSRSEMPGPATNTPSFDAFDRLAFLKEAALPLQHQLALFIRERGLELNTNKVLNYEASDLFSPDALKPENFPGGHPATNPQTQPEPSAATSPADTLAALGKQLFSDASLSGNGLKSCASCHSPEKMFTDRLPLSVAFDGHHLLNRNAPSLLYSGFQYNQFWDGRVHSLEDQIRTVLSDPREMNADTTNLEQKGGTARIAMAIAAYVRTLHPMNSPFDQYMRGTAGTITAREKRGANLFMGKAQCATCHFIPLFNGLIPPDYAVTEFEVLGTTRTDRWEKAQLSTDAGRYTVYPFPFFKGAFKTPTVRNAALTYPYMHNGAFRDLRKLMEFYNKGGGAGLGLQVPDQTLPSAPLHLSPGEIDDIILFIHTLTDSLNKKS